MLKTSIMLWISLVWQWAVSCEKITLQAKYSSKTITRTLKIKLDELFTYRQIIMFQEILPPFPILMSGLAQSQVRKGVFNRNSFKEKLGRRKGDYKVVFSVQCWFSLLWMVGRLMMKKVGTRQVFLESSAKKSS